VSNCKSWGSLSGFWAECAGPGIFEDCEAWDMHKHESYDKFRGTGFVIGSNAFGVQHINCISHDCEWRCFSSNGWHDLSYINCEAYDVVCNGPYGGGGFILGGSNNTNDQTIPIGNFSVINCKVHDISNGTVKGRGIATYTQNPIVTNNDIDDIQDIAILMTDPANNPSGECAYNNIKNYGECIKITIPNVNTHDNTCV
jgi:hypothetical protein